MKKTFVILISAVFAIAIFASSDAAAQQAGDWSCKCACPCSTPGAMKDAPSAYKAPAPAPSIAPSAQPAPYASAPPAPPYTAAPRSPSDIGDTRMMPVDMNKAPITMQQTRKYAPLPSQPAYAQPQPSQPAYTPPPAAPSYGSTPQTPPPSYVSRPPASTPAPAYAPPPASAIAPAQGAQVTGAHSDLPSGWDEPTVLPPGSIRLEDVRGRPIKANPQAQGMAAAGQTPAPASAPAARPVPAPSYPQVPTYPAPAYPAPAYTSPPPETIEEIKSDAPAGGDESKPPPARWGN